MKSTKNPSTRDKLQEIISTLEFLLIEIPDEEEAVEANIDLDELTVSISHLVMAINGLNDSLITAK